MSSPSTRSRPAELGPEAPDTIQYPTPRYGYPRFTEAVDVHLLGSAEGHSEARAHDAPIENSNTSSVRITSNWRWNCGHPTEVWGERTIEVPTGSTVRLTRTAEPGSSQHPPTQPSAAQPAAFVPQLPQASGSGSRPEHQDAAHSSGTPSVLDPTLHDASNTPIDRRAGAQDNARRVQVASSPTPSVAPDDRWRRGANGHANAEANEALGRPDLEQVSESLRQYQRYAEPNPPVNRAPGPSSSTTTPAAPTSSTTVEGGRAQPPHSQADPTPVSNRIRFTADNGAISRLMPEAEATNTEARPTEAPHMQEYYRNHPDRARPHHRYAQPLRSALHDPSRNENGNAGTFPRPRPCRPPGRYDLGNEEFFIPPLPSPRQQPTPPHDDGDSSSSSTSTSTSSNSGDSGNGSDPRAPLRGAHIRHSRGIRGLLKRVQRMVFPCTATGSSSSRPRNPESSAPPWRREETAARPQPNPPVANHMYPGYTVHGQGFLPPGSVYHPGYGLTTCAICRHYAAHAVNCPMLHQPTQAPPPPDQGRDPVGNRGASRATQREERQERHNRSREDRHHTHRSGRQPAASTNIGTSTTTPAAEPPTATAQREPWSIDRAGQIGEYHEGSPGRMDYWVAPPLGRVQNSPQSPPPVIPPRPRRFRHYDTESEERRHRRHRHRDIVTDVPVIPSPVPDITRNESSDSCGRDHSTQNRQLETPPPSREPTPNTPSNPTVPIPQPVPAVVWAQPMIPAGFPFPAMFPAITWVPHPQPHPTIPAATFWQLPRGFPRVPTPAVPSMTGGWPLPGTAGGTWQTPAWPLPRALRRTASGTSVHSVSRAQAGGHAAPQLAPDMNGPRPIICPYLIPNPVKPDVPWLDWDVRMPPSLAKRYTARETVVSASDKLGEVATHPPVARLSILYTTTVPALLNYWGAIPVDKGEGGTVDMGAILDAVHNFFQVPLTRQEASELKTSHPVEWCAMSAAFKKRCRDYPALSDFTWMQGMRRVDALADRYKWWGMWVHWNPDGTWFLNLGMVSKKPIR